MRAKLSLRSAAAGLALIPILWVGAGMVNDYLNSESTKRPHDFLQVWSAGRLAVTGENPYDPRRLHELQHANRTPLGYAAMMWVPPWGLALAAPVGAMPINAAQVVWVFGQFVLIASLAVVLWRLHGGPMSRAWVALALVFAFAPVWWQMMYGQYAGLLLLGLVGFLAAHRANRPTLAGGFLFLIALKPHLFTLFAIGLLIDASRTAFGRRVVLGGALVLLAASGVATAVDPHCWRQYYAAATAGYTAYSPGLSNWFPPTMQGVLRDLVPGKPFWVQFIPVAILAPAFAVYWWRTGSPQRWPSVLLWLVPLQLLTAPYGSWPSDWTLLLIPAVALAVRLDATGWAIPGRWLLAAVFVVTNAVVPVMHTYEVDMLAYSWVAPVLVGCMLWARRGLRSPPGTVHDPAAAAPADGLSPAERAELFAGAGCTGEEIRGTEPSAF